MDEGCERAAASKLGMEVRVEEDHRGDKKVWVIKGQGCGGIKSVVTVTYFDFEKYISRLHCILCLGLSSFSGTFTLVCKEDI